MSIKDFLKGILSTTGETLFSGTIVDGVVGNVTSKLAKRHPRDEKWLAQLKDFWRDGNENARIEEREIQLKLARDEFNDAMKLIADRTKNNENDKNNMFVIALRLLNNENMLKLAIVLFDNEWAKNISQKFDAAHKEFMWCGLDEEHVHFYYRLSALRLALFCDVYRKLMRDKSLKEFDVTIYLGPVLAEFTKCIENGEIEFYEEIKNFACEILLFTEMQPKDLIEKLKEKERKNQAKIRERFKPEKEKKQKKAKETKKKQSKYKVLEKLVENTTPVSPEVQIIEKDIIVNWLSELSKCLFDLLQKPLKIYTMCPMLLAACIINEIYIHEFKKYNPFNVDLGFQFDMNSWIPIKLIKDISDYEKKRIKDSNIDIIAGDENSAEQTELFRLIADELAKTHLVIITGTPGAGKTTLAHKIAFDYASENSKLPKYDIVLMTEFRKISDKKNHNSIIDMALYGLEKMTENSSLSKFIKRYIQEYINVLIVLDGYDEAVDGQCSELNELLSSYGSDKKFDYDLIVTRRPTRVINRKEKLSFTKMVGFNLDDIIKYIEIHFANHEDKDEQIKSVIEKFKNNATYEQMAATPLLLTFICLVHAQLEKGTRVELYEKIVCWFIQRKLIAFPNLLAKLDNGGNIGIGLHQDMADFAKQNYLDNWMCFDQFKRLGYICLMYLADDKYQFSLDEISNLQSNLIFTINIFAEIGILYSETAGLIGKQITIYQFAHQSFQEYFATIYALKWEEECKMNRIDYSIEQQSRIAFPLRQRSFFIEILLTERNDRRLIKSAAQYLIEAKSIRFDIQSSIQNESWQQLEHVSKILDKCLNINEITIDVYQMLIDKEIELVLPNVNNDIKLWIRNGIFKDNQSNMISISQTTAIDINFSNCRFTLTRLSKFVEYVDTRANQFKAVRFYFYNDATIDAGDNTITVYNKQYTGILQITQKHSFNEKSIYNIIQLFSGIKTFCLGLIQPKIDEYIQEAIAHSTLLTNLTELEVTVKTETNEKEEVGNRYYNYINKILQHCSVVNTVYIDLENATIEVPIDLQFLPIKHCITVTIREAIFNDNQLNMVTINDSEQININFLNCRFTLSRLSTFADYVNTHANQFKAVRFFIDSSATMDTDDNTSIVCNKRYTGILQITQEHSFNEKSIYNIIQLFSGIKSLGLTIFQPKTDKYIQETIAHSTLLTNLTKLELKVEKEINEKVEVSNRYWNYINKILQQCPVVNKVKLWFDNATIEEPIDLQFLPIKHCITVTIMNAILNDNQLNMVVIAGAKRITIQFYKCQFTDSRLMQFALYVDANVEKFERIDFAHVVNEVDIDEYTQHFKNFIIRRRLSNGFSIVKRDQQITDAQQQQNGNELQDIIHLRVTCDICGMNPIIGILYKCSVCDNYYLCSDCKRNSAGKHDEAHKMISIDDPNDQSWKLFL